MYGKRILENGNLHTSQKFLMLCYGMFTRHYTKVNSAFPKYFFSPLIFKCKIIFSGSNFTIAYWSLCIPGLFNWWATGKRLMYSSWAFTWLPHLPSLLQLGSPGSFPLLQLSLFSFSQGAARNSPQHWGSLPAQCNFHRFTQCSRGWVFMLVVLEGSKERAAYMYSAAGEGRTCSLKAHGSCYVATNSLEVGQPCCSPAVTQTLL